MKRVDPSVLRDDGELVLLTVEEVVEGVEVQMADFRDTHALFYAPLSSWMGLSSRGVQLSRRDSPPELRNGIWYVRRDEDLCAAHENLAPKPEAIVLRVIDSSRS